MRSHPHHYDVAVVGGGPSGCAAAERLARAGWQVAVLEEHPQFGHAVNCSGVIGVEAFEKYALPRSLVQQTLRAVAFRTPRGAWWRFDAGRPLAHAVDRSRLDRLLGERAREAGARLLLGHRVMDIEREPAAMRVCAQTCDGQQRQLEARSVVLATGAGVPLLKKLGWGESPRHVLGAQSEVALDAETVEIHLGREWAPEGFAWIVPLGGGMTKVGLLSHRNGPHYLRRFLDRPDLARRIRGEPGPIRVSVLPLGFLPRSYGDRILVAGEAAGHIKTTTCGGIYYGMLTAGIAADVLDAALRNDRLDGRRLRHYEIRWRRLLEKEIEGGLLLRRAVRVAGDRGLERLVDLAQRDGVAKLIQERANFDWHRDLIRAVFRHATVGKILSPA